MRGAASSRATALPSTSVILSEAARFARESDRAVEGPCVFREVQRPLEGVLSSL